MKSFWKSGDPFVWLTGGALAVSLIMVVGLILLIMVSGLGFFWPAGVERLVRADGTAVLGQVMEREAIPKKAGAEREASTYRLQVKRGNRDLYGSDFVWIDEIAVTGREVPHEAAVFERREWGNFYGTVKELREGDRVVASGEEAWRALGTRLPEIQRAVAELGRVEKDEIGATNYRQEEMRLRLRALELKGIGGGAEVDRLHREMEKEKEKFGGLQAKAGTIRQGLNVSVRVAAEGGESKEVRLDQVVRVYRPNEIGFFGKSGLYLARLWEFLWEDPRESNTEGGVFPAIFGTVMMVVIMSIVVTPLGVLAALYLREYAKQGPFVSAVRIAVNNLAGVPSIVFGVFGVGFFVYFVGGGLDRLFFPEKLPTPTFGTGGILWASLTLALLTVPVVIVSTEEGLAAIPKGLREASLALGATKWETTWKVVLPSLMPSILTGLILAMARAAGEVAPLMITGVVKLAPALPLDGHFPFFHLDRKFMHLGFHIYDVGFQSPNVDAARPMVFTTAFLLLVIVVALNLAAVVLRKRLRARFAGSVI
jgi:phosphate transport system permease protein